MTGWIAGGCFAILLAAIFFRSRKARLIAVCTLAPLVFLSWWLHKLDQEPRLEETVLQEEPSVFGDGSHSVGASHASQGDTQAPAQARTDSSPMRALLSAAEVVPGLTWLAPADRYTPNSLWSRINGAAEHYKGFGLRGALFGTATLKDTDYELEIQIFHLGDDAQAAALFDSTERGETARPMALTNAKGILWDGGGELAVDACYIRIVSTQTPAPDETVAPILRAIAAPRSPDASEPTPTAPDDDTVTESVPNEPAPATSPVTSLANTLGVPEHVIRFYGIEAVRGPNDLRVVTLGDAYRALAWLGTLRPESAETLDNIGYQTKDSAVVPKGRQVVIASGDSSAERALEAASTLEDHPIPGLNTLVERCQQIDVQLTGWGGRPYLGPTLVGRHESGVAVIVAAPPETTSSWETLRTSFEGLEELPQDIFSAADMYQGNVVFGRTDTLFVGIAEYEGQASSLSLLREVLADL